MASRESPNRHQMKNARSRSDGQDEARSSSLRGDAWSVRSPADADASRAMDRHQTVSIEAAWNSLARQIFIRSRSPSDGWENAWKKSTIVARSSRNCDFFMAESPPRSSEGIHWRIEITINLRLWPDRGPIAARLWPDRGSFGSKIVTHYMPIRKPRRRPKEPLPRPLQIASTTASIAHDFGLIFPLKSHVFSLCSSTFDRFVKKLSEFRGRSLVHRDPPRV